MGEVMSDGMESQTKKSPGRGIWNLCKSRLCALLGVKARVLLVAGVNALAAADKLNVLGAFFCRFQRAFRFHNKTFCFLTSRDITWAEAKSQAFVDNKSALLGVDLIAL